MSDMRAKYILLGITIVAVIGMFSMAAIPASSTNAISTSMPMMMGHFTVIVSDADGNIKGYAQTDNQVTLEGTSCFMQRGFLSTSTSCPTGSPAEFNDIALGSVDIAFAETTVTATWVSTAAEVARQAATTNTEAGQLAQLDTVFIVAATAATSALEEGETVELVALFNSGTANGGQMLALFDLSTITGLVEDDTLEVNWDVKGGTDIVGFAFP